MTARPIREEVVERHGWRPNSTPQECFLSSHAQILIGGGAAGGGKSTVLLIDPLRFVHGADEHGNYRAPVPGYTAVLFRRTSPQITNEGGLWDESMKLYTPLKYPTAVPGNLEHRWPIDRGRQCTIRMTHLQHKWTVHSFQGAQIPYLGFDEFTHFDEYQFWYMLSRNRSDTGVPGLVRGGCNPDPDSFVATLLDWWIDQREEVTVHGRTTSNPRFGYPIPERAGVVRFFIKLDDKMLWAATRQALYEKLPKKLPGDIQPRHAVKSFTFVPFKAEDNVDLIARDPGYIGNLMALDHVERARLLGGNWKVRPQAGKVFPKAKVKLLPERPHRGDIRAIVRYWDKAASDKKGSDWSVGVLMALLVNGLVVVLDVVRGQWRTAEREEEIHGAAVMDGRGVAIVVEEEGGSAGKDSTFATVTQTVPGWDAEGDRPTGELLARSRPFARQWQVGNVAIVQGAWNGEYLGELDQYDGTPSTATRKDDQVAASAGAYNHLMHVRPKPKLPGTGQAPR